MGREERIGAEVKKEATGHGREADRILVMPEGEEEFGGGGQGREIVHYQIGKQR